MKVIREDNKLTLKLENKKEKLQEYSNDLDALIEDLFMNDIHIVFDSSIYYIDTQTMKVYYNTFYFNSITLEQELNHLLYMLINSNELELQELDEFEYTDLAQEDYLQDELLIDALEYNVNI